MPRTSKSHTGECLKCGILRTDLRFRRAESWRLVWLYRGETDKYKALLEEYKSALKEMIAEVGEDALNAIMDGVFVGGLETVKKHLKTLRESAKKAVEACDILPGHMWELLQRKMMVLILRREWRRYIRN